jgi:hypothetical protein
MCICIIVYTVTVTVHGSTEVKFMIVNFLEIFAKRYSQMCLSSGFIPGY